MSAATPLDDGGPAFPVSDSQSAHATAMAASLHIEDATDRERAYILARAAAVIGMTLRDYFAAHATENDIAAHMPTMSDTTGGDLRAEARYLHANAMLKARSA